MTDHFPDDELGYRLSAAYCLNAAAMLERAQDEPNWLYRNAVPFGAITYIVGAPGAGKSWLAYELAVCYVQGRSWLGFELAESVLPPSALVINLDAPTAQCAGRFKGLGLKGSDQVLFHSVGALPRPDKELPLTLRLPAAFEAIELIVETRGPELIVIDSLRKAHTLDESNSQQMAEITDQLRMLAGHAAVVVVHHTRKKKEGDDILSGELMRGSSEIEASADAIIHVGATKGGSHLATWVKTRDWEMEDNERSFFLENGRVTT